MSAITIKNDLNYTVIVYDSYQEKDKNGNYYGTLTKLGEVAANSTSNITPIHDAVNTVILFDEKSKPLARYTSMFGNNSFEYNQSNVTEMTQAMSFVSYIGNNPTSDLSTQIKKLKTTTTVNAFFKSQSDYSEVTIDTYMLALTYKATHPSSVKPSVPPEKATYSLSTLVSYLSGKPYPTGMPDIEISNFFYKDNNDIIEFGGQVKLEDMKFKDDSIEGIIFKLLPSSEVLNVKFMFDLQVGLNIGGTKIEFFYNEIDILVGDNKTFKIDKPTLSITINPLFKFVVLEVSADFPFTLFNHQYDTKLSMVIDNVEVEVGFALQGDNDALPAPPVLKGIHFDEIGFGMGIIFEPPGYALGVQGDFHIGENSNNVVAIDDDKFALILELEEEVPNPLYISFYVPKFDLDTFITVFTNVDVSIGLPVNFSDLSFVWNENPLEPLALPDGTMSQGGYQLSGYMDLFGLQFYTNIVIDMTKFTGLATMDPLHFGNLLKLTGNGKEITMKVDANGNPIKNNQIAKTTAEKNVIKNATTKTLIKAGGPSMTLSTSSSPYFSLDAEISLFELVNEKIDAEISKNYISFELDYAAVMQTKIMQSKMICRLKDYHNFSGNFTYGIDLDIPLPSTAGFSLGSIDLDASCDLVLTISTSTSDVRFGVQGGFKFDSLPLNFGPFEADVNISSISALIEAVGKHVLSNAGEIFNPFTTNATKWAGYVKNEIIKGVTDVAQGIKTAFGKTPTEVASIMHVVGYGVDEIASGIKTAFSAPANEMATALKDGFGASDAVVTDTLKDLGYGVKDIAVALKAAGFAADEVGSALKSAYSLPDKLVIKYLEIARYTEQEIASVAQNLLSMTVMEFTVACKAVEFGVDWVAGALKSGFKTLGKDAISLLYSANYAADKVASAMKSVYGMTSDDFSKACHIAELPVSWAATGVSNAYKLGAKEVSGILNKSGYVTHFVSSAPHKIWNDTGREIIHIL